MSNHDHSALTRRGFLGTAAAAAGATLIPKEANAASPVVRTGTPHMKLSLAAYSFNRVLKRRASAEELKTAPMRMEHFIGYCAELDLDGCEPTSYYFPAEFDAAYLNRLKNQAFKLGLDISGTAIGNDFCLPDGEARQEQLRMTREWIDHAAVLGAPVIRIFAGKVPKGGSEDEALRLCIDGINESLDYAAEKGVFLALENHGGITATPDQMFRIIDGVKDSPWFGVNFDSGNFNTDDPYRDLARIAPYAVNAQIKVMMRPNGGREPADFSRIVGILKDAGYRGYVVLEYEEEEAPKEAIPRYIDTLRHLIQG